MDSLTLTNRIRLALSCLFFIFYSNGCLFGQSFHEENFGKKITGFRITRAQLDLRKLYNNDTILLSEPDYGFKSPSSQTSFAVDYARMINSSSVYFTFSGTLILSYLESRFYRMKLFQGVSKIDLSGLRQIIGSSKTCLGLRQLTPLGNKFYFSPYVNTFQLFNGIYPLGVSTDTSAYDAFGETENTIGYDKPLLFRLGFESGADIGYKIKNKTYVAFNIAYSHQFSNKETYIVGERVIGSHYPWIIYGAKQNVISYGIGVYFGK